MLASSAFHGMPSRPGLETWLQIAIVCGLLKTVGIAVAPGARIERYNQLAATIDLGRVRRRRQTRAGADPPGDRRRIDEHPMRPSPSGHRSRTPPPRHRARRCRRRFATFRPTACRTRAAAIAPSHRRASRTVLRRAARRSDGADQRMVGNCRQVARLRARRLRARRRAVGRRRRREEGALSHRRRRPRFAFRLADRRSRRRDRGVRRTRQSRRAHRPVSRAPCPRPCRRRSTRARSCSHRSPRGVARKCRSSPPGSTTKTSR